MSLVMNTFVSDIGDDVIPDWLKYFENAGMPCEIHPDFSFADQSGFLPFKLSLMSPAHEEWLGKSYLTGFEFFIDEFDLAKEIDRRTEKPSGLKRLFGAKPEPIDFISPEVDARLADCKRVMSFVWGASDTFEMRMATVSAAILAEITNGVCGFPAYDEWYENAGLVQKMADDARDYEASLKPREFRLEEFEAWR